MEGGSLLLRRRGTENDQNKSGMDGGQRAAGGEGGGSLRLSRLSAGTTKCQGRVSLLFMATSCEPCHHKVTVQKYSNKRYPVGGNVGFLPFIRRTRCNDWTLQQLLHQSAAHYTVIKFWLSFVRLVWNCCEGH